MLRRVFGLKERKSDRTNRTIGKFVICNLHHMALCYQRDELRGEIGGTCAHLAHVGDIRNGNISLRENFNGADQTETKAQTDRNITFHSK